MPPRYDVLTIVDVCVRLWQTVSWNLPFSVAAKLHFQTHDNVATVSHFVTTVSICVNSSIDSEPRFHVSLILTATILSIWHSTPSLFFSNSSVDYVIMFFNYTSAVDLYQQFYLFWHSRSICINSSIDSEILDVRAVH